MQGQTTTPDCHGDAACQDAVAGAMAKLPAVVRSHVAPTLIADRKEAPPPAPPPPVYVVDPPTEFQRFASASVGSQLPIYGSQLFQSVPATFAPVDRLPVTPDYVIGPGDELLLRVWGQVNLNLELTVDRTGAVYIPQAGSVVLSGVAFRELPEFLRGQLSRVFRNFDLNVTMGQLRSIQIFVVGQARRPGSYTVSSMSTLVNAIFACGGPSSQGSMRAIELKRDNTVISQLDLYRLILEGDKSADRKLSAGDVIYFPVSGPQAALAGSIRNPAIYELKGPQTVDDAIRMAGGLTAVADRRIAKVERINQSTRGVDDLTLDAAGLATLVADGDVIRFPNIAPQFEREVTLRGNVANPGRFPWRPGLRLGDILPHKDALTTRSYWEKHNQLGFMSTNADIHAVAPEINWSYAVIERRNDKDLTRQLVPFHLGKLVLEKDPAQNLELQAADVVTILSHADLRVPVSQQNRFVRLEGEFKSPGIYEALPGETLAQLIERTGGFSKDAYLYGAELTRESVRRDQQERLDQLIREIERDAVASAGAKDRRTPYTPEDATASVDEARRMAERLKAIRASGRIALTSTESSAALAIPLEDGDRFMAPPKPATVGVLGAVYNSGALLYDSNLRLRDYLRLAGGCTRAADQRRVFVIRADGTVVSKQSYGHFGSSFELLRLKPGDSIVAPEAPPKRPILRGMRDWTMAISQFGFSAAAINTLR
jgi:protein involved in polysaccharide export with SLBB domain